MKKIQYKIDVNASAEKAYKTMLGLTDKKTYEKWTAVFNSSSTYEGSWEKGSKMLFIGVDQHGKKGGMISRIEENIPNEFLSIKHYGILKEDVEILDGPEVEQWAGCFENYYFKELNNMTTITVELDVVEDHLDYFNTTYPKALTTLKEIIEQG